MKLAGAITHLSIPDFIQRAQSKRESIASVLPISVTVEGHTAYDEINGDEKHHSPPHDTEPAPPYPPGLSPLPQVYVRDTRGHAQGIVTPPPTHSFDDPASVWTSTMGSIA